MRAECPDWDGRTVVCIASGPSLTAEDCDAVRAAGHPAIVTNSTFRAAPWASILFGYDSRWWRAHIAEIRSIGFAGRLISGSAVVASMGVETIHNAGWLRVYPNSGACAISIAVSAGAARVVLLGFDCAPAPDGRMHWHADHPPVHGMTNCGSIRGWPRHFQNVARDAERAGVEVVNASLETRLRCFRRVALGEVL